jgi:hypothetical protein
MIHKPLVRWSIGKFKTKYSLDCLRISIKKFKKIYGDQFNYILCINNDELKNIDFGIPVFDQTLSIKSLSVPPEGPAWKIYPPRLNYHGHEIFMDNDLIIHKRIKIIDIFLKTNDIIFATEGYKKRFGKYDNIVPEKTKINTGLFGVPPEYNLYKKIEEKIKGPWESHFDEQGILAAIFFEEKKFEIIPLEEIFVCADKYVLTPYGMHFVGLNGGKISYFKKHLTQMVL